MCCENFLLLLKYGAYFFLEGKELLFVLASHGSFHCAYIFFYFFVFLLLHHVLNLYLLFNFVGLLWWSLLRINDWFFNGVRP